MVASGIVYIVWDITDLNRGAQATSAKEEAEESVPINRLSGPIYSEVSEIRKFAQCNRLEFFSSIFG